MLELGRLSASFQALLLLMLLDQISGVVKAVYYKRLDSEVGVHGLMRKGGCLLMIVAAHVIQPLVPGTPPLDEWFTVAFSFFELLSITENLAEMGVPLPTQVVGVLAAFSKMDAPMAKIVKTTKDITQEDSKITEKSISIETVVKQDKPNP